MTYRGSAVMLRAPQPGEVGTSAACERRRHDQQDIAERGVDRRGEHHHPDHDDAVDRVRSRHEWCVQGSGDLADDLEPDEQTQDEDRDVGE
jgi:hypothetical protein